MWGCTPALLLHCGVRCILVHILGMHPCTSSCPVMICILVHIVGMRPCTLWQCIPVHNPSFLGTWCVSTKLEILFQHCVLMQRVPRCILVHNTRMRLWIFECSVSTIIYKMQWWCTAFQAGFCYALIQWGCNVFQDTCWCALHLYVWYTRIHLII